MPEEMTMSMTPTQNPDVKVIHTRMLLVETTEFGYRGHPDESTLNDFGKMILAVDGVTFCAMMPYRIQVEKSPAFTWGEVEKGVGQILKGYLKSQRDLQNATFEFSSLLRESHGQA